MDASGRWIRRRARRQSHRCDRNGRRVPTSWPTSLCCCARRTIRTSTARSTWPPLIRPGCSHCAAAGRCGCSRCRPASSPRSVRDKFLKRFADLLGPPGPGPEVDVSYADLALPYLPPFSVSEPIIDGPGPQATPAERDAFKTLRASCNASPSLTLFAPQTSRLGARARDGDRGIAWWEGAAKPLRCMPTRRRSAATTSIDYGVEDGAAAHELARLLRAANFEVFIDIGSAGSGTSLPSEIERALDYSACVLLCFGASSTSASRKDLLMRARASARPLRLVPVLLPHGSADAPHSFGLEIYQFLDLRDGVEASALERLVASQRQGPGAGSDDPAPANPYRGPLPYGEDDARLLFGRDGTARAGVAGRPARRLDRRRGQGRQDLAR